MEVKCKICGTINDGETNFCKGCFVKLDKEEPKENNFNPHEKEIEVPIMEEPDVVVPWMNDDEKAIKIESNNDEWKQPDLEPMKDESLMQDEVIEEKVPDLKPIEEKNETIELKPISEEVIENDNVEINMSNLKPIEEITEVVLTEDEPVWESNEEQIESNEERTIEPLVSEEISNNLEEVNIPELVVEEPTELKEEKSIEDENVLQQEEVSEEKSIEEPIGEEINENLNGEKTEESIPEEKIEEPVIEGNISETISEAIPNEVISTVDENGKNLIVEEPIPELSEFNNWDKEELPQLDMKQFEIDEEKKDNWNDDIEENESLESKYKYVGVGKIFVKLLMYCAIFGIIFGALCIGFRYLMTNMFNMGVRGELIFIVVSSVTSVATLLIAADVTLKKTIPLASKINLISILALVFIALPYLLIKIAYNLYIGSTIVIILILVALSLIILAIFFNYIRNNIRRKHDIKGDDKVSFIYGIISIVLVLITLGGVYLYKDKDQNLSLNTLLHDTDNKNMTMDFIYQVEKTISNNKSEKDGYVIPNVISDLTYAEIDGKKPKEMTLYINENGGVTSGTITYKDVTYTYNGQTIEAK